MRIALISDLHANAIALSAVLAHARSRGVDQVVCLGDTATLGPEPTVVLQMLRDARVPCIMGNHDEFLLDAELIRRYTEAAIIVDSVEWCRDALARDELEFVKTFKRTHEIALEGGRTLLLFHGSPASHMDDVLATTPGEKIDALFGTQRAEVMAGGHTHIQMLRQHKGSLIVNPGSVGMPFKEYAHGGPPVVMDHAEYATVESDAQGVSVTLHRVSLDRRALRSAVEGSSMPLAPSLARQYA